MDMIPAEKQSKFKSLLKKPAFWVIGIIMTAIAGFASDQVKEFTCLTLPDKSKLRYSKESPENISYGSIESTATRNSYQNKKVKFRALVYGEVGKYAYLNSLNPKFVENKIFINTRSPNFKEQGNPSGLETLAIPNFMVIADNEIASKLKDLKPGAIVEFSGTYKSMYPYISDSIRISKMPLAEFAEQGVFVDEVEILKPINNPADRALCRILHSKELIEN